MNAIPDIPGPIVEGIKQRKFFVFAGAGVSVPSGYPTWKRLILDLIGVGSSKGFLKQDLAQELNRLTKEQPGKLLTVAQELSDAFTRETLVEEIVRLFKSVQQKPSNLPELITEIPFGAVITTNYDQILDNAYAKKLGKIPDIYTHKDAASFGSALHSEDFFILKAHGDVSKRDTIILTNHDYRSIIHASPGYRAILNAVFLTKSILFVGVSLDDPETEMLLSYLHHAFHASGPNHYALVPGDSFSDVVANRWRKDYKVNCIRYEPSEGHPEVIGFLSNLKKLCLS